MYVNGMPLRSLPFITQNFQMRGTTITLQGERLHSDAEILRANCLKPSVKISYREHLET